MTTRMLFRLIVGTLLLAALLAALWRFSLEAWIDPWLFGFHHGTDEFVEHLEFIVAVVLLVTLALTLPSILVYRAIREKEANEEFLRLTAAIIEHANEGIMVTDTHNRIVTVNPAFSDISGYSREEVVGRNPRLLASGHHPDTFYQEMWAILSSTGRWAGEIWNRRKNGEIYAQWLSIFSILDHHQQVSKRVGIFNDITERKRREDRIAHQAYHDILTGLPNRQWITEHIAKAMAHVQVHGGFMAVMFLDLDRFKPVNDTHGHAVGDRLLQEIAKRLRQVVRREDQVSRIGGDEFLILLRHLGDPLDSHRVAEKILAAIGQPVVVEPLSLQVGGSIGIAVFPGDGDQDLQLIQKADEAMYVAKQKGRNTFHGYQVLA